MDENLDIEAIIRENVMLLGKTVKGWEQCVHAGCDHGKRGPRSAFIFNSDTISFNCFNCGISAVLDMEESKTVPPKFRGVLEDFGVPSKTIDQIGFYLLQKNKTAFDGSGSKKTYKVDSIVPKPLTLPSEFKMLDECDSEMADTARLYLSEKRLINPDDYPFMFCEGIGKENYMKKWNNRLIIPIMKNNQVVFYQGRDVTGKAVQPYMNATDKDLDRSKVISDYDVLFEDTNQPLYIVEGWFDAFLMNGVAIFGNNIHENHYTWINKSYREKVFIPDRYGDGMGVALKCLEKGWKVSVPYKGLDDRIKDVGDIFKKYGKLFGLNLIQKNTLETKTEAEIFLQTLTK